MPRLDARWWMLAIAVLAGGLAAWAAQRHVEALLTDIEARSRQPMRSVVVAAVDLGAGARLDADVAAQREMPAEWAPGDAILPDDFDAARGVLLAHAVRRGEPILWGYLAQPEHRPFSAQLAAGRRAVTIPVDEISSLSGMLEPGDVIDLYVSFMHQQRRITAPLLQSVRVLATGRQHHAGEGAGGGERGFATVTLDASPEDAVRLVAARQQGSISAMLRHAGDGLPGAGVASGDLAALLGLANEPERREVPVIFGDRGPGVIPGLGESGGRGHDAGLDGFAEDVAGARAEPASRVVRARAQP